MAKPLFDRIVALNAKKEKLDADLNAAMAKAKVDARKRDTRRKILVGGAILAAIASDPGLAGMVSLVFDMSITRPADREMVGDLLEEKAKVSPEPATGEQARAA